MSYPGIEHSVVVQVQARIANIFGITTGTASTRLNEINPDEMAAIIKALDKPGGSDEIRSICKEAWSRSAKLNAEASQA